MKISDDWLRHPATQAVCQNLEQSGFQALFVGGCVRNTLLNMPVGDIDIATDAHPETVMDLAEQAGFKAVPTGIEHGTVTVVSDGLAHEVTTFRRDVETFGRHATVAFSRDVADDARRRDFTMNALYASRDGTVIDPLGGLPDLIARRVRFIENAHDRIREDYLRILRFFRFHAWYGADGLDQDGLAASAALAKGIAQLSRERVGAEMLKLLSAPDPAPAVAAMRECGVLSRTLPGTDDGLLAPLVHLETRHDSTPDAIRRLATLGGEAIADRLRLSKAQARKLALLREEMSGASSAAELGYRHGAEMARDVLLLRAALADRDVAADDMAEAAMAETMRFPVSASDLMPDYEGPALGRKLKELERRWIASRFTLSRDQLLS